MMRQILKFSVLPIFDYFYINRCIQADHADFQAMPAVNVQANATKIVNVKSGSDRHHIFFDYQTANWNFLNMCNSYPVQKSLF